MISIPFPEAILKQLCYRTRLEYNDDMLKCDDTPEAEQVFQGWEYWVKNAMKSLQFQKTLTQPKSSQELESLPDNVKKSIKQCLPVYKKLYALRMKPKLA